MKLIIAQILGIGAVIAFLLSYQMKKRRSIILTNAFSRILFIIQCIIAAMIKFRDFSDTKRSKINV